MYFLLVNMLLSLTLLLKCFIVLLGQLPVSFTGCVLIKKGLIHWNAYIWAARRRVALLQHSPQSLQSGWKRWLTSNSQMTNSCSGWHDAEHPTPAPPTPTPEAHLMQSDNSGNCPIQSEPCVQKDSLYWFLQPTDGWEDNRNEKDRVRCETLTPDAL